MPPEAESIALSESQIPLLSRIEGKVQTRIQVRVVRKVIDRRWHYAILDRQNTGDRLSNAGCTKQVSGHRFGRTDVQLKSMIAEKVHNSLGLTDVTHRSGCSVNVDIINIVRRNIRIAHSIGHGQAGAQSF